MALTVARSNVFKEPIAEKEKEVEQLSEQRSEKLNRVKAVEKEKDGLEGGKREAEAYLEQDNEVSIIRWLLWSKANLV